MSMSKLAMIGRYDGFAPIKFTTPAKYGRSGADPAMVQLRGKEELPRLLAEPLHWKRAWEGGNDSE